MNAFVAKMSRYQINLNSSPLTDPLSDRGSVCTQDSSSEDHKVIVLRTTKHEYHDPNFDHIPPEDGRSLAEGGQKLRTASNHHKELPE